MKFSLVIALVIVGFLWGSTYFFTKILLESFGPWSIVFLRSFTGAIGLLFMMKLLKKTIIQENMQWRPLLIISFISAALPWTLMSYSQKMISSSMSGALNATVPLWTLIIGAVYFKIPVKSKQWLGVTIGFTGILLLLNVDFSQNLSDSLFGVCLMLIVALCYTLTGLLTRRFLAHLSVFQISLSTLVVATLFCGVVAVFIESFEWSSFTNSSNLWSIFFLGFLSSGVGYVLFYFMVKEGGVSFATFVTYLIPIVAVALGMVFLEEKITVSFIAGFCLVLLGIAVSSTKARSKRKKIRSDQTKIGGI